MKHLRNGPELWSQKDIEWFNNLSTRASDFTESVEHWGGRLECDIVDGIITMFQEDENLEHMVEMGLALHYIVHISIKMGVQLAADYEVR